MTKSFPHVCSVHYVWVTMFTQIMLLESQHASGLHLIVPDVKGMGMLFPSIDSTNEPSIPNNHHSDSIDKSQLEIRAIILSNKYDTVKQLWGEMAHI